MRAPAAFAIPGDLSTRTGGYIYEGRLLEGLRARGHDMTYLKLPDSFPDPTPQDMAQALAMLEAVPPERPLILDGFVFGAGQGLERLRAPIVGMVHHPLAMEEGLSEARRAHLRATERANVARAAHILVPSPHTRQVLVQQYGADPARVTIAPPGVDRPTLPRAPEVPPLILSVGILHPRKGHDVLLDALAALTDLDWRAVIVGKSYDAAHAAALAAQVDRLGLGGRVTLAGEVEPAELESLYSRAALFALATRYEGYGMVFAEALVRGLPVVATRTGAVPDTVPAGTGLLAPPGHAPAFAAALRTVLADDAERARLTEAAARDGARLPTWDDTAEIAGDVLDRIAAGAR
ncbi:glycosyltransferase family 1 protein [Rhodovulum sp. 12E13]|uniref:glycosyltransferase family 4 protein n=1 Tax=Rhodovulum sp. 12E13 TaxID=2203891 RepID=UPI000E11DCA7|nr:glycosyltransferase family 4 protein [Rhodovulum sp. 12E13]RDC73173.1 glycosyltransferase family 1 protein [Rhodovulum sp. 12E13]